VATSRRSFLHLVGLSGLAATAAGPSAVASPWRGRSPATDGPLRLSSNENSYGPGEDVLGAIRQGFPSSNRYPFATGRELAGRLASTLAVPSSYVVVSGGSSELLNAAISAFTTPGRGLVTAVPTFELPAERAGQLGHPVSEVPLTDTLSLDLDAMAAQSAGAGLVYVCNPNNPTGTVHGGAAVSTLIDRVAKQSPQAIVLVDEAYHEYVEDPSYQSAVPLAVENPRIVVSRTFSKIYGMAGLRVGYAIGRPETLARLTPYLSDLTMSCLSGAAAIAALGNPARVVEQRRLNHEARQFTEQVFRDAGYRTTASEANFLMVDVQRDIRLFQRACQSRGVQIARPFPPLTNWARITVGTMAEMQRAVDVFRAALAEPVSAAAALPPLLPGPRAIDDRGVC
jgi:histidinol-phosphate aminotransferase